MTAAVVCGVFAAIFFLLLLYSLDLIFFLLAEKKRFEGRGQTDEYIAYLEKKQKKAKHPQKKNYYLYLICLALFDAGQGEKAGRLLPFLHGDPLLGLSKKEL